MATPSDPDFDEYYEKVKAILKTQKEMLQTPALIWTRKRTRKTYNFDFGLTDDDVTNDEKQLGAEIPGGDQVKIAEAFKKVKVEEDTEVKKTST